MPITIGGRSETTTSYTPSSFASLVKLQYIGNCGTTVKAEYMGAQVKGGLDCRSTTIYLRLAELQNDGDIRLTASNYAQKGVTADVKITEYSLDLPYSILSIPAYLSWLSGLMLLLVYILYQFKFKPRLKTSSASES